MKSKKNLVLVTMYLLLLLAVTGCSGQKIKQTKNENKTQEVQIEQTEDVQEMVVAVNVDSSTEELPFSSVLLNRNQFWGGLVFRGLLMANENINNVEKDLCEEYTISPDGKTYVFVLRDDIYWHDGKKITVDDVVFSIELCLKVQEVNGYLKKGVLEIVGANEFETGEMDSLAGVTTKENNITIKITTRDNRFLGILAQLPILPKHCLKDVPIEEVGSCDFWKMPVGSGPYKVVGNRENKEAVLIVNQQYTGKKPKIEQIRYKVLENPETDYFDFTITSNPTVIKKYQETKNYKTRKTDNLYYRYLYFNLDGRTGENEGLLKSQKVRQALAMAVDKEKLVEEIYAGSATIIDAGIPQNNGWYAEIMNPDLSYNPENAKKLLMQENFDFSKTLVLTRYNQDEISVKLLEFIAQCWHDIGVKTEITEIGTNATERLWVDTDWYDVGLKNLAAADFSEWYYEYSSENQMWSKVLNNREVFNVIIKALDDTKWAYERTQLYQEIQQMEKEQMFKIPLIIVPQYVIYNSENLYIPDMEFPNLHYYYDFSVEQWELLKNS